MLWGKSIAEELRSSTFLVFLAYFVFQNCTYKFIKCKPNIYTTDCNNIDNTTIFLDDDLRKKYDTYGEEGLKDDHFSNKYQSWNFYNEQFGIYDDDPEIITLSKADFGTFELL